MASHVFLAFSDYANSGGWFCQSLNAVGESARIFKERAHLYQYPDEGTICTPSTIGNESRASLLKADYVWIVQSDLPLGMGGDYGLTTRTRVEWEKILADRQVVLLHGGSHYRKNRQKYVDLWSRFNPISICYEADLIGGFEREFLFLPPVDLRYFPFERRMNERTLAGHFPSRPSDKGSDVILGAFESSGIKHVTSVTDPHSDQGCHRLPWLEHLKRMAKCDVIVDQLKPTLDGTVFGEWVSLATEASALGCVTIANSLNPAPYVQTYGRMPGIRICNDRESLLKTLIELKNMGREALYDAQKATRQWIEDFHALEPSGERLKCLI